MKRGLLGLFLLLSSFSLATNSCGFMVVLNVPSAYTVMWNVVSSTPIIYYPLHVSSDESISVLVKGGETDVQTGFGYSHDFIVTLNAGVNTLNLSASDSSGGPPQELQAVIHVIPESSTVSIGGSTQSIGIEIPVGAVDQFYTLSANVITQSYDAPNTASLNGLVVDVFFVSSTGNIIPTSHFSVPVILELPYFGTATQGVAVAYLDTSVSPSVWRYDGINVLTVDIVAHKLWVSVEHFTIFGVFTFEDRLAPIISQLKANNLSIMDGSFIRPSPIFSMSFMDDRPTDSGVVSYNITLIKMGEVGSHRKADSLVATAQIDVVWDLSAALIPDGDYRLNVSVEDASGLVSTQSITLFCRSEIQILNFLAGPNPVNIKRSPSVHFTYDLSKSMATTIYVFDVAGRRVRQIQLPAGLNGGLIGPNDVIWDGQTDQGTVVPAGLYLVYIKSDEVGLSSAKRFMLLVTK